MVNLEFPKTELNFDFCGRGLQNCRSMLVVYRIVAPAGFMYLEAGMHQYMVVR